MCTLSYQTNQQKFVPAQIFASHGGIMGHYSHQAGGLPLLEEGGCHEERTVCAFKDFVFNQRICWN